MSVNFLLCARLSELCKFFTATGQCRYGTRCQYAHGGSQLRPVVRHPKYRTKPCRSFQTRGVCRYGEKCRFLHVLPERCPVSPETSYEQKSYTTQELSAFMSSLGIQEAKQQTSPTPPRTQRHEHAVLSLLGLSLAENEQKTAIGGEQVTGLWGSPGMVTATSAYF